MTGQDNHKTYTAADIRRYLSGQMSEAEMFALESAALEDPFLADAIEGFDQSGRLVKSNPTEDIKELHARLQERITISRRRRLPVFLKKNIAAILILLAGVGSMVYYLVETNGGDRTYISQKESAPGTLNARDSVSAKTAPAEEPGSMAYNNETRVPAGDAAASKQSRKEKSEDAQSSLLTRQSALQPARPQSAPAESTGKQFEKDLGYSSAIKPGVNGPSGAAQNRAISGPVTGPDTIDIKEKVLSDDNNPAGELPGKARASDIKLQDSIPSRMMETANTTQSRAERQSSQGSSPAGPATGATPVIGWKAFDMYVQKNRKLPQSLKNVHGKVVLSFTIGKNGKPGNFQVVESLNKTMDEEAIRLVKEGPPWTTSGNSQSPVLTTVNF